MWWDCYRPVYLHDLDTCTTIRAQKLKVRKPTTSCLPCLLVPVKVLPDLTEAVAKKKKAEEAAKAQAAAAGGAAKA